MRVMPGQPYAFHGLILTRHLSASVGQLARLLHEPERADTHSQTNDGDNQ